MVEPVLADVVLLEEQQVEEGRHAQARLALIEPELGGHELRVALVALDLPLLAEKDVVAAAVGAPALPEGLPPVILIGVVDAAIVLYLVLVLRRRGIRVALAPEGLDEAVALLHRPEIEEHVALAVGDDVEHVALQPGAMLLGELLHPVVGASRRCDEERDERERSEVYDPRGHDFSGWKKAPSVPE